MNENNLYPIIETQKNILQILERNTNLLEKLLNFVLIKNKELESVGKIDLDSWCENNKKFSCLLGQTYTEQEILDLLFFMMTRARK